MTDDQVHKGYMNLNMASVFGLKKSKSFSNKQPKFIIWNQAPNFIWWHKQPPEDQSVQLKKSVNAILKAMTNTGFFGLGMGV